MDILLCRQIKSPGSKSEANLLRYIYRIFLSQIIQYILLPFLYQSVNHFAEQGVYPGKPGTGEVLWIVFVERFVHETGFAVGIAQHFYAVTYLFVVVGRVATHDNTHRPNKVETDVRATDTFAGFPFEEVWVGSCLLYTSPSPRD